MDWTMIFSGWAAAMATGGFALLVRVTLRQERHSVKINELQKDVGELQTSSRKHSGNIRDLQAAKRARA